MNSVNIKRFPTIGYACEEAVNTLCTNLSLATNRANRIMITSSHSEEGKSFISMNVMKTLAKLGKKVVLIDADLRKSRIISRYGLQFEGEHHVGLSHYLLGKATEDEIVYQTNIEGAKFIPVGRLVGDSLSMLSTMRLKMLIDKLIQTVDYVIIDTPPLGEIIDAAEIAKSCDGTVIVVRYDKVHRQELVNVKDQLDQTGCPILGTVLNQVEFDDYMSKKYYYRSYGYYKYEYGRYGGYGYGRRPEEKKSAAKDAEHRKK